MYTVHEVLESFFFEKSPKLRKPFLGGSNERNVSLWCWRFAGYMVLGGYFIVYDMQLRIFCKKDPKYGKFQKIESFFFKNSPKIRSLSGVGIDHGNEQVWC